MMRAAPLAVVLLGLNQPIYAQVTPAQFVDQNWVVSETTSPVDYSPLIMATNLSRPSAKDGPASLIIRCRGKRAELALTTNGSWGPANFKRVTYQINDQSPVQQGWTPSPDGRSATLRTDVIGFVRALPDTGYVLIRVYGSEAVPYEATFQLSGLGAVRRRLAVCTEN
jgi:hypothetical protein